MNEAPVNAELAEPGSDSRPLPIQFRIAGVKTSRIDRVCDFLSDWFSPILVKETRQALKSRQFFWTFFLLLIAVAVWTMIGMTINDTSVDHGSAGSSLLVGYWAVLGFPLGIVIPFGAYRSLAREYDDGTIQLISVTTMKSWQIVAGKLGSSMLQMLVYLSVLAPCIAFTFLLKGLSIPQISIGMAFCVSGSFALSCIALFFASATHSKIYGVGASILLIALQFFSYFLWIAAAGGIASGQLDFLTQSEGQFLALGLMAAIVSTGLLMFAAATVLISFPADNRSTPIRIMMLVQQTLFIGWCICMMCYFIQSELPFVLILVTSHYWLIMGFVLIGEQPVLSQRVRRTIPHTIATRSMFSLLLPGTGRGLIFATVNIWICGAAFLLLLAVGPAWFPSPDIANPYLFGNRGSLNVDWFQTIASTVSACLYPSFFLAVTWLILCAMRRVRIRNVNSLTSLAVGVVLILAFTGFPMLFHFNFLDSRLWDVYTSEQLFNWYWTSSEIMSYGFMNVHLHLALAAALVMAATCGIALAAASRELLQTRVLTPVRVEQELEELRKIPPPPPGETIDEIFAVDRKLLNDD